MLRFPWRDTRSQHLAQTGRNDAGLSALQEGSPPRRPAVHRELSMAEATLCFVVGAILPLAVIGWMIAQV